jgi:hypothetical protein
MADEFASLNRHGERLSNHLMACRLLPGELAVSLNDQLDGFLQTLASFIQRSLLDVASRKLLHVPEPPVTYLLEDTRVAVVHGS